MHWPSSYHNGEDQMSEFRKEIAIGVTVAVVVATALAIASISSFSGPLGAASSNPSQTLVESQTTTYISQSQSSVTIFSSQSLSGPQYHLTFQVLGTCNSSTIYLPWGVTIWNSTMNNQTESVPTGTPLAELEQVSGLPPAAVNGSTQSTTTITASFTGSSVSKPTTLQDMINFTLPVGTYYYQTYGLSMAEHGTVIVNGTSQVIQIQPLIPCYSK